MLLFVHVVFALVSLFYTVYALWQPSRSKLFLTYVLVILTTLTGAALIASNHAHMTQTCATGVLYFACIGIGVTRIRTKLSRLAIQ